MSTLAPPAIQARLLRVLQRAFVQSRNLALSGDTQHLADLADTFELLPELMVRWDGSSLGRIRDLLAEYQARCPGGYEYLALLDGEEEAVENLWA